MRRPRRLIDDAVAAAWRRPVSRYARIGFAYNPTSEPAIELRERAAGWCRMRGVDQWAAAAGDTDALCASCPTTDVLVVLGGDGTFLRAAQAVIEVDVPMLGINLGKVGFLSKAEADELEAVLEQAASTGAYELEPRMALEARDPAGRTRRRADVHARSTTSSIARGSLARVVRLDVDDRRVAPGDVHRRRPRRRQPDRLDRVFVLGRRPDPRPDRSRNLVVTPIAGYLSAIRSVVVAPHQVVRCQVIGKKTTS